MEISTKIVMILQMVEELKALQRKFNCLQVEEIDSTIQTLRAEVVGLIAEDFDV